jgi:hypothetical protein
MFILLILAIAGRLILLEFSCCCRPILLILAIAGGHYGVCQAQYHIYHLPIWVIPLHAFNIGCVICVWDPFFDVNSTVM